MLKTITFKFDIGDEVYYKSDFDGFSLKRVKEILITSHGIFYRCFSGCQDKECYSEDSLYSKECIDSSGMIDFTKRVIYVSPMNINHMFFISFKDGRLYIENSGTNGISATHDGDSIYAYYKKFHADKLHDNAGNDYQEASEYVFWSRIKKYCEGMTRREIIAFIKSNIELFLVKVAKPTEEYKDIVLSVKRPKIERYAENKNTHTFDIIRIEERLKSELKNVKIECEKNKEHIIQLAIDKISKSDSFKRYNVPINILELYDFVITVDNSIILSFCIKSTDK